MATNDGGPAFPGCACNPEVDRDYGMTLRDYFAAKAMAGIISVSDVSGETLSDLHHGTAQVFALKAYIVADAMLSAREVKP